MVVVVVVVVVVAKGLQYGLLTDLQLVKAGQNVNVNSWTRLLEADMLSYSRGNLRSVVTGSQKGVALTV